MASCALCTPYRGYAVCGNCLPTWKATPEYRRVVALSDHYKGAPIVSSIMKSALDDYVRRLDAERRNGTK
jgi:hypothetical protein